MKFHVPIIILICGILIAGLFSADCSAPPTAGTSSAEREMITVTDMMNRTVTVVKGPQRIIGIGAGSLTDDCVPPGRPGSRGWN